MDPGTVRYIHSRRWRSRISCHVMFPDLVSRERKIRNRSKLISENGSFTPTCWHWQFPGKNCDLPLQNFRFPSSPAFNEAISAFCASFEKSGRDGLFCRRIANWKTSFLWLEWEARKIFNALSRSLSCLDPQCPLICKIGPRMCHSVAVSSRQKSFFPLCSKYPFSFFALAFFPVFDAVFGHFLLLARYICFWLLIRIMHF